MRALQAAVLLAAALLLAGCEPAASASAAPGPASAPQTFEWTLLSTVPRGLPGPGTGALRFAERIETMSAGRLRIAYDFVGLSLPLGNSFSAESINEFLNANRFFFIQCRQAQGNFKVLFYLLLNEPLKIFKI